MRRRLLPVLFVASAVTIAACGDSGVASGAGPDVVYGPAQADIDNEPPYGPGVKAGETYDYVLYTHCGVKWAEIDGVVWRTTTPLANGSASPPPGWGNPYDDGQLRIVDETTAIYDGGPDAEVTFERTGLAEPPSTCM